MRDDRIIKKGDIFHIDDDSPHTGDEMWSDRPGLVISNDVANKHAGVVTIVYLTSSKKKRVRPTHVNVLSGDTKALALCEQVYTVDKSKVKEFIGHITDEEMKAVDSALMFQMGINPSSRPISIFKKWENYIIRNNMNIDEYMPQTETPTTKPENSEYVKLLENEIETLKDELSKYQTLYSQSKSIITSN